MGPWARAFLARFEDGAAPGIVSELAFEPGLITARVGEEQVALAAPPIPAGVWAALAPTRTDLQSETLAQTLDHTWDEPLVPEEITRVGSAPAVAAVGQAAAAAIDEDPSLLLRWRGHAVHASSSDEWGGSALPALPAAERRPPDSVPKRLGATGITVAGADLMEVLVGAYRSFEA